MPVDPRMNCAAEICCPPRAALSGETPYNTDAHAARVGILLDLGVVGLTRDLADRTSRAMSEHGICFMPQALADIMREIAFP